MDALILPNFYNHGQKEQIITELMIRLIELRRLNKII